jgi:AcrR family transcriptional regulator
MPLQSTRMPLRGARFAARVADRRERLIAVAFELLAEKGASGVTVREVCARAKLNPRYFYESFVGLDALLVAVLDDQLARLLPPVLAAIDAAPERERAKTEAAIRTAFTYLTDDRRRIRVLLADPLGNERLARRRREVVRLLAEQMADQAAGFYAIDRAMPLLRSSTYLLAGGLIELLIAWDNGSLELTTEELITDAAALVSGTGQAARAISRARLAEDRERQELL